MNVVMTKSMRMQYLATARWGHAVVAVIELLLLLAAVEVGRLECV